MATAGRDRAIDVSVVVPVLNGAATLPECLESLVHQSLSRERYEVIVVDNGSSDGSDLIAERAPGVVFEREPRRGAYAARNRGVSIARGDVIAFTDPDCVVDADWLETAVRALSDEAVVVLGETLPAGDSRPVKLLGEYSSARDEYVFRQSDWRRYYGRTNNMAVVRSALGDAMPFAEMERGADTMLVHAIAARHGPAAVLFDPRVRVRHAEVDGFWALLRKTQIYGYVYYRHVHEPEGGRVATPALGFADCVRVLRRVSRHTGRWVTLPALTALIGTSTAAWQLGRWRAALNLAAPRGTYQPDQGA